MEYFVRKKEKVRDAMKYLADRADGHWNWDIHPVMKIEISAAHEQRSLSQNALYWEWMEKMSGWFTKKGRYLNKDQCHELMCHKFLGYRTLVDPNGKEVGKTLNTTTSPRLSVGEMVDYMTQVDEWAQSIGCLLPTPADSAYAKNMKKQNR